MGTLKDLAESYGIETADKELLALRREILLHRITFVTEAARKELETASRELGLEPTIEPPEVTFGAGGFADITIRAFDATRGAAITVKADATFGVIKQEVRFIPNPST